MALPPLVAELIAKTDNFQAGLARASQSAQKSAGDITGSLSKISAGFGALGIGVSLAGVAGFFAKTIQDSASLGDQLYKMSQRVGVSVETLSTLRYAADLSGISMEDLGSGLTKMSRKVTELANDGEKGEKFLRQFGIEASEVRAGVLSADEVLKRLADTVAKSPDGMNKATAAFLAMGKGAEAWIPFLNQGREGIESLQSEATKLGLRISTETAQRMEAFNDQLRTLKFASEGAAMEMASRFMPQLEGIARAMRDATIEGGKLAGIIAGLSVYKYGTHQDKNDADLVRLTEKKLQLENDIVAARNQGNQVRVNTFTGELNRVEAELKTTLAYRQVLEETTRAEQEAARQRERLKTSGAQLVLPGTPAATNREKDRTAENERAARAQVEAEEQAARDISEAWRAWEKQQLEGQEETAKAVAEMWKQVYKTIDDEQERAIEEGQRYLDALAKKTKEVDNFARDVGLTFSSAFEDAIVEGRKLQDVLQGVLKDLLRIVARKTITEPFGQSISDLIRGEPGPQLLSGPTEGEGFFDGILQFLGFRAGGGPVQAGGAYVVGERGPELFVPGAAGTVVPNGAMGNVEVNIINKGPPVSAQASAPRFDAGRMIVDVVLTAARQDGNFRAGLAGALAAPR
ncbi:MAG: hypothetical protein JNM79_01645 [Burkholderiales bacterium]|nr:hypothetical protein [Burkholderiales bacterium]